MERIIKSIDMSLEFDGFEALEKASFGSNANSDYAMHQWIFDNNPFNPDTNMMYVMKDGDKVIAADGLWPVPLYYHGKSILGAHSIKSMTHPDYKRQGIFGQMTENSVAMAQKKGIDLVFGLANDQSYKAYQKFGWPTYFEKDAYVRPLRIEKVVHKKMKSTIIAKLADVAFGVYDAVTSKKLKPGYTIETFDTVPESVESVWQTCKSHYEVTIERSFAYLDYRYNRRPDTQYTTLLLSYNGNPIGFSVYRIADTGASKVVSLCECFTNPQNADWIANLLTGTINTIRPLGGDYIVASFGGFGLYIGAAEENGFKKTSKPPKNNMMIGFVTSDGVTDELLSGYERWHLSQGDGETELDL